MITYVAILEETRDFLEAMRSCQKVSVEDIDEMSRLLDPTLNRFGRITGGYIYIYIYLFRSLLFCPGEEYTFEAIINPFLLVTSNILLVNCDRAVEM